MSTPNLFTPIKLGNLELANRIVMAPLTRGRADVREIPNALMQEYYTQRASAGLIISEATHISPQGRGWFGAPGIYSEAQIQAWQLITQAVHQKGGKFYLQLWHMGRASHPDFQPNGELPVSASAIAIRGEVSTPSGKKPHVAPRALEIAEIPQIVQDYVVAAKNAIAAGFDGVEIHGANGYLIDQFLRDGSNQRTDDYGGSIENRARFLLEVTGAVVDAIGGDRVALRLSPTNTYNDMSDRDPVATFTYAVEKLNAFGLAYLHILEALPGHPLAAEGTRVSPHLRKIFKGLYMLNGGYDQQTGEAAIANGEADLIAYGVPFIANPDLVERFRLGSALNPPDQSTFYTHGAEGYIDYPTLS
ncbi:NADH:flavin oxidoreductase [Synechococcus sp. PCC 7502]|uniref:alkene reductase n=1 Tax=Synechococcus sp. PCC 7502 TaxID=1173263 RepID=UPI00029FF4CD|nr:alkene reductase [Synechococcus sp. PCC 7502]AFY73684.1 NADH:flavin oxidoreductase [Synechococcus sp. PCC 7502]